MNDLTIFVISTGENPNYADCISALQQQTLQAPIDVILGFAPMDRAFQEMLNRCKTKYFIQIDEDMVLSPDAVEKLYDNIRQQPPDVAFTCFELIDPHLKRNIFGVKIYRNEIMQQFPYVESLSCEREQMDRMEAAGYRHALIFEGIGQHSPKWTPELIFDRYYDLGEKWKKHRYIWMEDLPGRLTHDMLCNPSGENYYAAMGATMSIINSNTKKVEKNFTVKNRDYLKIKSINCRPLHGTLYITGNCNYQCPTCQRQKMIPDLEATPDMGLAGAEVLLKRFSSLEGICICGFGEPFMNPHLPHIVKVIREQGKVCSVISNGSLILDRVHWFDSPEMRPNFISISLNAATSESHQKRTGAPMGAFERILWSVGELKKRQISVYFTYIADRTTADEVPAFLRLCNEYQPDCVYIHNLLPHRCETEELQMEFQRNVLTASDWSVIQYWKTLPGANLVQKWPTLIDFCIERRNCQFPFTSIAIDARGAISLCNSIEPVSVKNGNINDHSVWHSDYAEKMRLRFSEKELPFHCRWCFRNWE